MKYILLVVLILELCCGVKVDELVIMKSAREIRVERQLVKVSIKLEVMNKGKESS